MSKSQLPEVLIPVNKTTMSNVDIYTSVLEPVNKSQKRLIFNIRQQGILNAGSRLVMSVHPDDTASSTAGDCFLPLTAGIAACIDSAVLRAGTKVLARTEKFGKFYAMKKSVHTSSQKQNIDMVLDGGVVNVGPSPNTDGLLAIDTGSAIYSNKTTASVPDKYKPVISQTDCPTFSVALSDLFPMMRGMMLPVFAMAEQVSVEINLIQQLDTQTGKTIMFRNAPGTTTATTYALNNFAMHLDYLEYDMATMASIRAQVDGDGMPMRYPDIALTTTQLISPAVAITTGNTETKTDVREVGTAGMKVNNIMVVETNGLANPLAGEYRSDAMIHPPHFNWRVNDKIIYPRKLTNTSHMRNEMEQILEFPMSVANAEYSNDVECDFFTNKNGKQNLVFDANVNMMGQASTTISGNYFITGLNLRKGPGGEGTDVINKNVLYERDTTYSFNDQQDRKIDFFVEHERSFILKGGVVLTSA